VMAIVGGREMRDGRVSLRERDGSQADVPAGLGSVPPTGEGPAWRPCG
jgi:hypothetical protein